MNAPKYIVTTGWWCDNDIADDREQKYGSDITRKKDFFLMWHKSILENSRPEKIIVIDSASPQVPEYKNLDLVHWVRLDTNPGHSTKHIGKFSGVTYAHVLGMMYAVLENVDYWVYIEQDALLKGNGIVDHAISQMKKGIMFGSGKGTPQPVQQSFMIIKRDKIPQFVAKLLAIDFRDGEMSPEYKFSLAASPILINIPSKFFKITFGNTFIGKVLRRLVYEFLTRFPLGYQTLPFGYGRSRPINFSSDYFYFQHASDDELTEFCALEKSANIKN